MTNSINRKEIESLLPHRDPMLLIDELVNINKLKSISTLKNYLVLLIKLSGDNKAFSC